MEYRQLSPSVRARISELYSGRLWQSTGGLDEQQILSSLPASIRRNVSLLMYAELLLNVPLFTDAEFGFIRGPRDHHAQVVCAALLQRRGHYARRFRDVPVYRAHRPALPLWDAARRHAVG